MKYVYGMRLRGFSPLCQPMYGLVDVEIDRSGKYYNILIYSRELTEEEVRDYELDYIGQDGI